MHILVKRRQEQETAGVEHLKIIYNFFAISHGKGAVDGIGGTAKRGGNNFLRYESSTLILYKELSSTIFQSCQSVSQSGIGNTCPDLHFLQYIKA